jgi:hypothetical protein
VKALRMNIGRRKRSYWLHRVLLADFEAWRALPMTDSFSGWDHCVVIDGVRRARELEKATMIDCYTDGEEPPRPVGQ